MKVLIAGGGLAGLSAAWELHKHGHETIVFEAKNRVGGRAYSHTFENGSTVELGGEYVFPDYFAVRRLAAEIGIPIVSHGVSFFRRETNGVRLGLHEMLETRSRLGSTLREMLRSGAQRISTDDLFREVCGEHFRSDPVYRQNVTALQSDPSSMSAEALFNSGMTTVENYLEDGGRFVGGNQAVPRELARRLDTKIRLESPVSGVSQSSTGVEFVLADGSRVAGDAAVLAVPLPILREMELDFEWTSGQQEALTHRDMGEGWKFGAMLTEGVDLGGVGVQSSEIFAWSWQSRSRDGETRQAALSGVGGTSETLQAVRASEGPEGYIDVLRRERPGLELVGEVKFQNWAADPWTRGSYSMPNLEWTPADDLAFDELAGRVAIAGEHTKMATLSYAVETGWRAAGLVRRLDAAAS